MITTDELLHRIHECAVNGKSLEETFNHLCQVSYMARQMGGSESTGSITFSWVRPGDDLHPDALIPTLTLSLMTQGRTITPESNNSDT